MNGLEGGGEFFVEFLWVFSLFRVVMLGSVCFPVSRVWGLFVCYCVCEVTYRFRTPSSI